MADIRSLMHRDMITATADENVAVVARRMHDNGVGAVLVVEGDRLAGIFSERDLLDRVIAAHRHPAGTQMSDVATREVKTVDVEQPVKDVLAVFRQGRFRHLPVVEDGRPVGIVSVRDLLEFLVGGFERYIDDLKYQNAIAQDVDPYDHLGGSYGR